MAPGIFQWGADSSDKGAKMLLTGYSWWKNLQKYCFSLSNRVLLPNSHPLVPPLSAPWGEGGREGGRERVSSNADKSGQWEGGGLAVSGHSFQFGFCKREEDIYRSLCRHLPVLKIER